MDAIANEPIDTTHTSPNNSLPEINPAAGLTANNLIYVNSITPLNYPSPTITISRPPDKSVFKIGTTVVPVVSCDDAGGPGLASCTFAKTLDTSLFGSFQYTVTATDNAGTTVTKSIQYTVVPYFIPKAPKSHPPLLTKPYHTTKDGHVSLGLLCTAKIRCIGKLRLLVGRHHTVIASKNYSVGPGHTVQLSFRLNKTGRHLLHKAHGVLKVTVTLKPAGPHTHTAHHKLTLRVQRPVK
jgi:hypothetical protein